MRKGSALGAGLAALAAISVLSAPPAEAVPEQLIRAPLDYAWDGEACGEKGGYIGPGSFSVPHLIPSVAGDPSIECASQRTAVARSATAAASMDARGSGVATEGTISTAFAGVGASHRIGKPAEELRYEVVVDVQEAIASVGPQFEATTTALAAFSVAVYLPSCKACGSSEIVFLADSSPGSSTGESATPGLHTVQLTLRSDGETPLRGVVDVTVAAFGFVLNGSHAGPAVSSAGVASTKLRVDSISVFR